MHKAWGASRGTLPALITTFGLTDLPPEALSPAATFEGAEVIAPDLPAFSLAFGSSSLSSQPHSTELDLQLL